MSSRRKFIATGAAAALTFSMLPTVGGAEGGSPDSTGTDSTEEGREAGGPGTDGEAPRSDRARHRAHASALHRAFRRARSRAAVGQGAPLPES